jgi:hypothetical protein
LSGRIRSPRGSLLATYPSSLPHRRIIDDADARDFGRLLPPRALHLDREQQTAGPDQSNELTPFFMSSMGDFLPYAIARPTPLTAELRSLGQT